MHKKGFTLIEVVTVIGIFALLTGLILANLNRGKHLQDLREVSANLVADMRDMQNSTLVGKTVGVCHTYKIADSSLLSVGKDCNSDSQCIPAIANPENDYRCEDTVPPGGFGIHFDPAQDNEYVLFADWGSTARNLVPTPNEYLLEPSNNTDFYVRTVALPSLMHIENVVAQFQFDSGPTDRTCPTPLADPITEFIDSTSSVSLVWTQPSGDMYTNFSSLTATTDACPDYKISILLSHERTTVCREITVNGSSGLIEERGNDTCTL